MNEKRRKSLRAAIDHLEKASDIVQDCMSDEQNAFYSLPEQLQWTERGEKMEEAVSAMEEAVDLINQATELVGQASE